MMLYGAFENVLRNAVRHTPDAGCIKVGLSEVSRPGQRGEIVIHVLDQGPGVPEAMLQDIFKPFVRVDQAHGEGIGLGLAISQRIIQAYRGRIMAENHPNGGLLVSIHLPASLH